MKGDREPAGHAELVEACEAFERYFATNYRDYGKMNADFQSLKEKVRQALEKARQDSRQ